MIAPSGPYKIIRELDGGLYFSTVVGPDGVAIVSTCGEGLWYLMAANKAWEEGWKTAMSAMGAK